MAEPEPGEPRRRPSQPCGLSADQENALLAIEMVMAEMRAHGDGMSQWRLAQIGRALDALDLGLHRMAMYLVERARTPPERLSNGERAEAAKLERRLEIDQLVAQIEGAAARAQRRSSMRQ